MNWPFDCGQALLFRMESEGLTFSYDSDEIGAENMDEFLRVHLINYEQRR
jgi:hypothetical protein